MSRAAFIEWCISQNGDREDIEREMNLRSGTVAGMSAAWQACEQRMQAELEALKLANLEAAEEIKRLDSEVEAARADAERLDWLESKGDSTDWVARKSMTGRGYRLHNTGFRILEDSHRTVRAAIDATMSRPE
jgi:phosphate uptake regulator